MFLNPFCDTCTPKKPKQKENQNNNNNNHRKQILEQHRSLLTLRRRNRW
eukprot:gene5286-3791_t